MYNNLMPQGIIVIYALIENDFGGVANQNQLSQWANTYNMTFPVIADANGQFHNHVDNDGYIPTMALIKYDGTLLAKDNENQIQAMLNQAAPPYGGPAHW